MTTLGPERRRQAVSRVLSAGGTGVRFPWRALRERKGTVILTVSMFLRPKYPLFTQEVSRPRIFGIY